MKNRGSGFTSLESASKVIIKNDTSRYILPCLDKIVETRSQYYI